MRHRHSVLCVVRQVEARNTIFDQESCIPLSGLLSANPSRSMLLCSAAERNIRTKDNVMRDFELGLQGARTRGITPTELDPQKAGKTDDRDTRRYGDLGFCF